MILDELTGKKTVEEADVKLLAWLLKGYADPDNPLEIHAAAFLRRFEQKYAFPLGQAAQAAAVRDAFALLILEGTLTYDPAKGTLRKARAQ
jgi:hypothetical protein